MSLYLTTYRAGLGGEWFGRIHARSLPDAERLARCRGLGERVEIVGERPVFVRPRSRECPSAVLASRATPLSQVHALCWLGLLACSAGVAGPRDFFDDEVGVLHLLAHLLGGAGYSQRERRAQRAEMLERIRRIERRVPGGV